MENRPTDMGGPPPAVPEPTTPLGPPRAAGGGGRRMRDSSVASATSSASGGSSSSSNGSSSDAMFRDLFALMRATIQPRVPIDLPQDASFLSSLAGQRAFASSKGAPLDSEQEAASIREYLEESLTSQAAAASVECAKRRVDRIRLHRKRYFRTSRAASDRRVLMQEAMHTEAQLASKSASAHSSVVLRGLADVEAGSARKLQELAFDIIGEYGKSFIRARRRCDNVSISDCKRLAFLVTQMRWSRFISKLVSDILTRLQTVSRSSDAALKGILLNRAENGSEIKQVASCIRKRLPNFIFDDAQVASIVKFERSKRRDKNAEGVVLSEPFIVENPSDFGRVEDQLLRWLQHYSAPGAQTPRTPTKSKSEAELPATAPIEGRKCYLHDFIDASSIEWLSPASHAPHIWDDVVSEEVRASNGANTAKVPDINTGEAKSQATYNSLDIDSVAYHQQFGRCFSLQHVTGLHLNRLYYCLEERSLWSQSSRNQSRLSDNLDKSSESVIIMMKKLEAIYVADKVKIDEEVLRKELDGVLDVCGTKATHRDVAQEELSNRDESYEDVVISVDSEGNVHVKEKSVVPSPELLLSIFPEVVQVCTSSGRVLHFASAMLANLIETSYFNANNLSAQEVQVMTKSLGLCHPLLSTAVSGLSSNSFNSTSPDNSPIARLYCITQPPLMPRSSRPLQLSSKSAAEPSKMPSRHRGLHSKIESTKPSLFMIPLAHVCHDELFRVHFGIEFNDKDPRRPLINASRILPDHPRLMCFPRYPTLTRNSIADSSSDKPEKFSHVYVLIECSGNPSVSDGSTSPYVVKRAALQPAINNKLTKVNLGSDSSYYFVQLRRQDDPGKAEQMFSHINMRLSSELKQRSLRWQQDEAMLSRILSEGSVDSVSVSYANASKEALIASARSDTRVSSSDVDKRKWDPQLLSSLCRWKACLCEASGGTESRHYCEYHAELKRFLDSCAANGADGIVFDTSKYVPRKPPLIPSNEADRDIRLIRWASHMLQEIHDGKLKASLQSFVKKVCNEMPLRVRLDACTNQYEMRLNNARFCFRDGGIQLGYFLSSSTHPKPSQAPSAARKGGDAGAAVAHGSSKLEGYLPTHRIPPSPAWAKWRDKASEDARTIDEELSLLKEIEDILRQISRLERRCSAEVQILGQYSQYANAHSSVLIGGSKRSNPQELAATESEGNEDQVAISAESLSLLKEELELVERKANLLKERRVDAEREAALASAARQDAMQQLYTEGDETVLDSARSRGDAGYYTLSARAPLTPKGRRDGEGGSGAEGGNKRPSVHNISNFNNSSGYNSGSNNASGRRTPNRTRVGARNDMQF